MRRLIDWQCSGCRAGFIGGLLNTCPSCKRIGYWTGSIGDDVVIWPAHGVALKKRQGVLPDTSFACDTHAKHEHACHNCRLVIAYHAAGQALGEKLATERIVAWLRKTTFASGQKETHASQLAAAIERGDHIASGAHDAGGKDNG